MKDVFNRNDWLELAHEENGHIFPTYYYWRAVQLACKLVNHPPGLYGVWYKNDGFSWVSTKGALAEPARSIMKRLEEDRDFLKKIIDTNLKGIPKMLKASEWFLQDLSKKSGEDIYNHYEIFEKEFLEMMQYSILGTAMEFEEPVLSNKATKILARKFGEKKAGQIFSELTLLTNLTSAQKEERDLIKLKLGNAGDDEIFEHWKKYAWVSFNYDGPGWTVEQIKQRLSDLNKGEKELEEFENLCENRKSKQKEFIEELGLNKEERYLFEILRTLGYWKFERKLLNGKSHYMFDNLMKEIGRRFEITIEEAKSILPLELKSALVEEKIDVEELKSRCKLTVAVYNGYDKYQLFSGEDAKRIDKDIEKCLEVDSNIKEVKGSTAYKGSAKGTAKIVNTVEDMTSFKEGDILISASTSPEIIKAMKKAAAIVTDSGGITCHAAIVARELKVPTIIGTKIATKVFKDGDLVEVDANKGIVRKIK